MLSLKVVVKMNLFLLFYTNIMMLRKYVINLPSIQDYTEKSIASTIFIKLRTIQTFSAFVCDNAPEA